ncbi:MAG: type II CAAX endopeptidase family protein [Beijerinckiaceae bacterium]|nr:type II CAAX endopeptidase family protein [Beijerinckiaceae bacterium]
MDQQTNVGLNRIRLGFPGGPELPALALSLVVILGLAALFAGLVAAVALLGQFALLGERGMRGFYLSLQFNIARKTELSALAVSVAYLSFAAAILIVARWTGRGTWRNVVALRPASGRWRKLAPLATVALIFALLTSYVLANPGQRYVSHDGPTDKTLIALIVLNLVVLAPLAEELFFRGWLFTALRLRFGFLPVLVVVSILFAAFHWDRRHMILVLPLAFTLGLIREQAGSIKPTFVLHAAYNLTIIAVTLLVQ